MLPLMSALPSSFPFILQTIRIIDLLAHGNSTLATINHDSRIDWLVGARLEERLMTWGA